jgi:hypothetical protein
MAGRGPLLNPPEPTPDEIICFSYDVDRWGPAREPLHNDPPIRGTDKPDARPNVKGHGLATTFARCV